MKKVGIAELKSRLSEHLRSVRRGHSIIVMDRDTPIARLVPYVPEGGLLSVREPLGQYPTLQSIPLPPALDVEVDVVAILLEERQVER